MMVLILSLVDLAPSKPKVKTFKNYNTEEQALNLFHFMIISLSRSDIPINGI